MESCRSLSILWLPGNKNMILTNTVQVITPTRKAMRQVFTFFHAFLVFFLFSYAPCPCVLILPRSYHGYVTIICRVHSWSDNLSEIAVYKRCSARAKLLLFFLLIRPIVVVVLPSSLSSPSLKYYTILYFHGVNYKC